MGVSANIEGKGSYRQDEHILGILLRLIDKKVKNAIIGLSLGIYSRLRIAVQVSHYMSQGYQNSDCFLFDLEPNFEVFPLDASRRKPSYDDILADLWESNHADPLQTQILTPPSNIKLSPASPKGERKERKRRENLKTLGAGQQRGHWQVEENKRYHWFLELHSGHFLNKHMRRMDKIFKSMERFVGTREAEQCRSHHQKMEKKHGAFISILKQLRKQNYGACDAEPIMADMHAHGVECNEELLSWGMLQNDVDHIEEVDSQKSTVNEISPVESFIDPIAQLNCQYEADLELLIL